MIVTIIIFIICLELCAWHAIEKLPLQLLHFRVLLWALQAFRLSDHTLACHLQKIHPELESTMLQAHSALNFSPDLAMQSATAAGQCHSPVIMIREV